MLISQDVTAIDQRLIMVGVFQDGIYLLPFPRLRRRLFLVNVADENKFFCGNMEVIFQFVDFSVAIVKIGERRTDFRIGDCSQGATDQRGKLVNIVAANQWRLNLMCRLFQLFFAACAA